MPAVAQNKLTFTISDGLKDSTMTAYVENGLTIPQIIALVQALAPLIDTVIKGVLKRVSLNTDIDVGGLGKTAADSTADVEEKATLLFANAEGGEYRMNIPTWDESFNATGSDAVDTADADVVALITLMEDGISTDHFRAYNDSANPLLTELTFQRGYELFVPR